MTNNDYNNIEVSFFNGIWDKNPTRVKLLDIVHTDKFKDRVLAVRREKDKAKQDKLKKQLPCFTPSAICEDGHSSNNVKEATGLLFVDFDKKDNEGVDNFADLPTLARAIPNILYFGRSARGEGFHAIMPIAEPERHTEYFNSVYQAFKKKGLIVDQAASDITRLCFVSYDPEGWVNLEAVPLEIDEAEEGPSFGATLEPDPTITDLYETYIEVARLIEKAKIRKEARRAELAQDPEAKKQSELDIIEFAEAYNEWRNIVANAFALSFGAEMGRPLFHAYSELSGKYDHSEADRDFTKACENTKAKLERGERDTLAKVNSFFKLCQDYGLMPTKLERDFGNLDISQLSGEEDL